MTYIFVTYIYDFNAIIVCPMALRTDTSFIAAFTKVFAILHARNYQPAFNVMDNECSKAVEIHIRTNRMTIQLVPPHNHHVNAAKQAIGTFKEHFIAALATADNLYPLQLWDEFLLQVKLTLNLIISPIATPSFQPTTSSTAFLTSIGVGQSCHMDLLDTTCY
jgi:hypothetical protein